MNEQFNWEDFEQITKSVIDVICGDKVQFVCSGKRCILKNQYGDNQFDVLYKWNSDIKTSYIAIECKYWNSLVDKDEIRDFESKCNDCKIDTKIIVSKIGFTSRAALEAEGKNIQLIEIRDFSEEDFKDCFKQRVLALNIDMRYLVPEIECTVNISSKSIKEGKLKSLPLREMHLINLVSDNGACSKLSDHVPENNSNLRGHGFEIMSTDKDDLRTVTIYKKRVACSVIKYAENTLEVDGLAVEIKETYRESNVIKNQIRIDIKEDIKKAGYLIAKKINERSNFVLDLKNSAIVDKN